MEITHEEKLQFKDVLVKDNVVGFKFLMAKHGFTEYEKMSDEKCKIAMSNLKAQMFYLGGDFVKARRDIRMEKFGYNKQPPSFANQDGSIPTCFMCKFFMSGPDASTPACNSRGALPEDVACLAFTSDEQ